MNRVWTVSDGTEAPAIAYFLSQGGAERYVRLLVERYALGKNLSLHGKQLAKDAGNWSLGLGPVATEHSADNSLESLPGAWLVKVDESCGMVACEFSTLHRPTKSPVSYRTGIHTIVEAYATTPHQALDNARKSMIHCLGHKPIRWER